MKYIDVSEHQGVIDWSKVKGNIDGVLIRAGYGQGNADKQFARNASECNRLGIPCGAYWFSYAYTPEMAEKEAESLLSAVKPFRAELPLAFDFEYDSLSYAKMQGVTVTKALASKIAEAFCDRIEKGGYYALVYANADYLKRYFDTDLTDRFGLWLAAWGAIEPKYDCQLWQYDNNGKVDGISGNVDLDEALLDFRAVIRNAGLNHLLQEYDDGDGGTIIDYSGGSIQTESDAIRWARGLGLFTDATVAVTQETLAEWLYQYDKRRCGLWEE